MDLSHLAKFKMNSLYIVRMRGPNRTPFPLVLFIWYIMDQTGSIIMDSYFQDYTYCTCIPKLYPPFRQKVTVTGKFGNGYNM